jgi:lipopolysaccharide transport protein LptA
VVTKTKPTKSSSEKALAKTDGVPKKGSPTNKNTPTNKKSGGTVAVKTAAPKSKPVVGVPKPLEARSDQTPAPPAKLTRDDETGAGSVSRVSADREKPPIGGAEIKAALKPEAATPPFSPDDDEHEPEGEAMVAAGSEDGGEVSDSIEIQGPASEPVISVAEKVARAQTPMVLVLGLAGGAGAAAWNAELPESKTHGGAAAAPVKPAVPVPAPEAKPGPSTNSDASAKVTEVPTAAVASVPPPVTLPEAPTKAPVVAAPAPVGLPTMEVMGSALAEAAPPEAHASPEAAPVNVPVVPAPPAPSASDLVVEAAPDREALVEPEGAVPAPEKVEPLVVDTVAESPTPEAQPVPAAPDRTEAPPTPAAEPPLSDLAELAGLADSLPSLPSRSGRAAEAGAAALDEAIVSGKAKATITALAAKTLPALPEGDARVVATALMQALPDSDAEGEDLSEEVEPQEKLSGPADRALDVSQDIETTSAPERVQQPSAPDELAPKRADRTGSAFEVPAAAGDLLIAANSQTDFQMDEKRVVFTGNVIMKNERFYLTADTLVAYMKENQSGLEFAEAQGNVVVRMVENGRETGSSGLAKTAVFHPETGEIILKGWPQLRMGNKAHVASAATTEMSLFTDGRMKTSGRNQTMIVP